MPSLKSIRKRINSVKSTQQITKAMKMVAAARLRRAQEAIMQARPYAVRLEDTIGHLAAKVGSEAHPLLEKREVKRSMILVISSDRGLCGAFNASINRTGERLFAEREAQGIDVSLSVVGKKGKEFFQHRDFEILHLYQEVWPRPRQERAREISRSLIEEYVHGDFDELVLVYNEFKSAISQKVISEPVLPIQPGIEESPTSGVDYIYEPDRETMLDHLLPLFLDMQLYRALLESQASEMGARMTAMEAATNNAKEMISSLTLQYNRVRQAAITTELTEIISGAEAL